MDVSALFIDPCGWPLTFGLFFLFLSLLYWYSIYPFSVLSEYGIKHPKPMPFFGNMFMFRQGFFRGLNDLIQTHGRVCGYYLGRRPVVVIADPDMLKQVLVRDFSNFPNRNSFRFASKPMSDCLLFLKDDEWKRVRSILTPSFSAAKMKEMVPLINKATTALMDNLKVFANSNKTFDIHKCFGSFTMDVIASVAFGTQVDSQNNPDDPFVHHAQMFFSFSFFRPIMLLFVAFPHILAPVARLIPNKRRDQMNHFFVSSIQKIIKQREEQPPEQRRKDFLQLMLDARSRADEGVPLDHFDNGVHSDDLPQTPSININNCSRSPQSQDLSSRRSQRKTMSEDEVVGQAFVFLVAGYETSSNTLAFTCYLLALHPESQCRVQEEVDDFFTRHESPDYTSVQELKYLDMVISEALRLYPPGFRFARDIERDYIVNGLRLPKGAWLEIPAGFLHHDPEYWPDPEKFIPERFTPEAKASRHPFVYLPFGAGPRNCVGMRLAQLEIKFALVNLFHRFTIVTCDETKVPLELKSTSTLGPKNGIFVKIIKRDMGEEPIQQFVRDIEHDCVVNGLRLPKGAWLLVPAHFLHHDEEYWPDPEKFNPERFTLEAKASRHPFVYLPFGAGPRSCIGMRLALLEIKIALVNLFQRFTIVACDETKVPIELKATSTMGPKNGVFVKIIKRDISEKSKQYSSK